MNSSPKLTPFAGTGEWLDSARHPAPLVRWLVRHDIALPDEYIQVLLRCESAAEVRFLLPIVTLSGWTVRAEDSFTDGRMVISVQEEIGGFRADMVVRDPSLGLPVVIEIDGPTHRGAEAEIRDRARTAAMNARGFDVRRVHASDAREAGVAFRRELMKQKLQTLELKGRSDAVVPKRRAWQKNQLAYNVAGLSRSERQDLLFSWLRSREISVPTHMNALLAGCDEAAEVNFLLPFVRLEGAYTDNTRFLGIDPYWVLIGQEDEAGKMDIILGQELSAGSEVVIFDVEPPPFISFDGVAAERKRRGWRRRGLACVRVGAERAAKEGQWWADRLAASIRGEIRFSVAAFLS